MQTHIVLDSGVQVPSGRPSIRFLPAMEAILGKKGALVIWDLIRRHLQGRTDKNGTMEIPHTELAYHAGCCVRTAKEATYRARRLGWLQCVKRGGLFWSRRKWHYRANRYRVVIQDIRAQTKLDYAAHRRFTTRIWQEIRQGLHQNPHGRLARAVLLLKNSIGHSIGPAELSHPLLTVQKAQILSKIIGEFGFPGGVIGFTVDDFMPYFAEA